MWLLSWMKSGRHKVLFVTRTIATPGLALAATKVRQYHASFAWVHKRHHLRLIGNAVVFGN